MPIVHMHLEDAGNLVNEYNNTAGDIRELITSIAPFLTDAYALLDIPGDHTVTGPRPALNTLANDLVVERDDVSWRVDFIRTFDAQPLGVSGRVAATVPRNIEAAFRQAGLTDQQAAIAQDLIDNGASFTDAVAAAQTDNPQSTLDAIKLAALNEQIDNWDDNDNWAGLDELLTQQRALINKLTNGAEPNEVDHNIVVLAALNNLTYEETLFSVTTANIDALTVQIENWSGTDNDPILDQLVRDRDEQIAILTEGDEELAQRMRSSLGEGMTAAQASLDLVAHIETQARIDAVAAEQGISAGEAEALLAEIDEQFALLISDGLEGEELEAATGVLYMATMQGFEFSDIKAIVESQDVDFQTAAQINANAQIYGMTSDEYMAIVGFDEHFDTFDGAYRGAYGMEHSGYTNGKVKISNLEYVVNNPDIYTTAEVATAQALLDQPQLLNRIDTAAGNGDLFANDDFFGSTLADDHEYSRTDLAMFGAKQKAFAQLNDRQDQIDIAAQGGAIDGHLSKSDYETFLSENHAQLSQHEIAALETVISGNLYDQTWWEENKNSLAMASALVGASLFVVATGGAGSIVVAGLIGAAAAGGTTAAINLSSDNLDWHEDLAWNTINGGLIGLGTGHAANSLVTLRTGAASSSRLLTATELTAEATGTIASGAFDPALALVLDEGTLGDVRTVSTVIAGVTGVGAIGAGGVRWINGRRVIDPPAGSNQLSLFDPNVARPGQQALFDPAPFNATRVEVPHLPPARIPGQQTLPLLSESVALQPGKFPGNADEMTELLGVPGVSTTTIQGTSRTRWQVSETVRITMESHPEGLLPGQVGWNPRHHGVHYHVQIRPDASTGWNNNAVIKVRPPGYTPGSGTGFIPGENFPR